VVFRRARHVIGEIARTTATAAAIRKSDWATVGRHMYASHYSLKEDYEVSCGELDAIVEIAQSIGPKGGVIGCRMTGGGFGGCTVALVKTDALEAVMKKLETEYPQRTSVMPIMFVSRPGAGATLIKS
jgi:galactokinase